jgi:predicted transcriptional regulator
MSKPIQIDENLHKELKELSKKSGIKIKYLVESAIKRYIQLITIEEVENK